MAHASQPPPIHQHVVLGSHGELHGHAIAQGKLSPHQHLVAIPKRDGLTLNILSIIVLQGGYQHLPRQIPSLTQPLLQQLSWSASVLVRSNWSTMCPGNTCLISATVYSVSDATGWLYLNFNHLLDIIPDADILT